MHTLLHEVGHSLGLADVNNTELHNTALDNQKYSTMSYKNFNGLQATELQLFDIAAIQEKYGRNYDTRATGPERDTVYSKDNILFDPNQENGAVLYSIWDGGGNDTINASGFIDRVQIDLRQGNFSSIGRYETGNRIHFDNDPLNINIGNETGGPYDENGTEVLVPDNKDHGNISIAFHTVIENAIGTDDILGDILIGNAWSNRLEGRGGDDWLYGDGIVYDGNEGFIEIDPDDILDPNQGIPIPIYQDDILIGGLGNDHLFAGAGLFDGAYFEGHAEGVTVVTGGGAQGNLVV